ncbi:hypothetical protein [Amycolatopsis sp. NBC_00438]|uniref:hypothetical protein n=1 Tax=Amycolatopsis sp. NBC_00438 TaxID=2903558 RepID=UPI002E226683
MSYYVIRDGSAVPSAVVELFHESAKAFTHDLEWVPADLPDAAAEECGYEDFEQYRYAIARHVREQRQRTEWRGEYEYFVHLESASFADTLKRPEALLRCREGVRERLGADGTWRAAAEDPPGTVSLPVTEAEHDRLRWQVATPQWSVAWDDLSYPVAVVRRIPAFAEAHTRNLRWEPVPPGLRLEEIPEHQAEKLLFALATGVRRARRTGTVEYFGILPGPFPRIDLDEVCSVVRRDNGVEEVYVRDGLWVRSDQLRDDWHRNLPLSAEEVERITARLPRSRCFLLHDGRPTRARWCTSTTEPSGSSGATSSGRRPACWRRSPSTRTGRSRKPPRTPKSRTPSNWPGGCASSSNARCGKATTTASSGRSRTGSTSAAPTP